MVLDERKLRDAWSNTLDRASWMIAREAVAAVRYEPRALELLTACGVRQPAVPAPVAHWVASARVRPGVVRASSLPHAAVRQLANQAARWFGPTASAIVRWMSGATAAAVDHAGAAAVERSFRARVHPGLLVPHPHAVAVLAIDMRGFSGLTRILDDTQYLADLVGDYLTELTAVVERHRGLVFQYTGDGLLALFLPELAGDDDAALLHRLVDDTAPDLHRTFDRLHARWLAEWEATGRPRAAIGLGAGASFGRATIGFLGPSGKKQFGVIGEPVNVAAHLCSEAVRGTLLVDRESFLRAGCPPPAARVLRLRSRKPHQRIDALCFRSAVNS